MAQKIYLNKLLRLTLVRKGRGVAKHPELRSGVVEVVKSSPPWSGDDESRNGERFGEPLWTDLSQPSPSRAQRARQGWYQ